MTLLWLVGAALAGGLHTGIPVRGVQGLGEPSFDGLDAGWSASVEGGFVRVFVGRTEGEASAWLQQGVPLAVGSPGTLAFADEAWGDGEGVLAFRDGNVSVFVRVERGARAVAERLRAAIVDGGQDWPEPPRLEGTEGCWMLVLPQDTVDFRFQGGRLSREQGCTFKAKPREIVSWDAWGRVVVGGPF